jgi:hypothetical protein
MKLFRTLFVASSVLVLSATALSAQAAQVTCKDGAKSKGGRGACSGHGGIAVAAKAETKAEKAEAKTEKTETKAQEKTEKAVAKADAKTDKTEKAAETAVAKRSHHKAKKAKA